MNKYIEFEHYDKMISFGISFQILKPDAFLQLDFYKWELRIGKL